MNTDVEKAANVQSNTGVVVDSSKLSFKQKMGQAKEDHKDNNVELCFAICGICLGTSGCKISSILFTLLPLAMIYFGATNLNNCPINSFIPIYLLVTGICTILDQLLIYFQCRNKNEDSETNKKTLLGRLFDTFVFIWFIVGSVYVYKMYEPNYDPLLGDYCDKTTYLFAFWSITVAYAMVAFFLVLFCCVIAVLCCVAATA